MLEPLCLTLTLIPLVTQTKLAWEEHLGGSFEDDLWDKRGGWASFCLFLSTLSFIPRPACNTVSALAITLNAVLYTSSCMQNNVSSGHQPTAAQTALFYAQNFLECQQTTKTVWWDSAALLVLIIQYRAVRAKAIPPVPRNSWESTLGEKKK